MRVKMSKQPPPAPTASAVGPCPTIIKVVGRPGTGSLPRTIAPPDHPKNGKKDTQNLTNAHERHVQLTEWTALSQTGGHSTTVFENGSNIYFYLFSILNYKTGSIMGDWYSAYHIAKDHIHTDITCNTEEPQQKYRLERSVIDYWGEA